MKSSRVTTAIPSHALQASIVGPPQQIPREPGFARRDFTVLKGQRFQFQHRRDSMRRARVRYLLLAASQVATLLRFNRSNAFRALQGQVARMTAHLKLAYAPLGCTDQLNMTTTGTKSTANRVGHVLREHGRRTGNCAKLANASNVQLVRYVASTG